MNNQVNDFLTRLKEENSEQYSIVCCLRDIVFAEIPSTQECIKYGGIMFSLSKEWGGLFVYKEHVSFEFSRGVEFKTQVKLEGKGKLRRHLKVKTADSISQDIIKELLFQVKVLNEVN